jgi:hypothetical protein
MTTNEVEYYKGLLDQLGPLKQILQATNATRRAGRKIPNRLRISRVLQGPVVLAGRMHLPDEKIGIEVDGYAYHSDPFTFTQDRQRQREIEEDGWRFIRFSGKEVRADPQLCLIQTARLVRVFRGESPTCW